MSIGASSRQGRAWLARLVLCVTLLLSGLHGVRAQTADAALKDLNAAQQQAVAQRADLLAPATLARAADAIKSYQKDLAGNAKPERLAKKLTEAKRAVESTQQMLALTAKTLQAAIKAYDDALAVSASTAEAQRWPKAEQRLQQAIAEVEQADLDAARKKGAEAEVLLRDLELAAIKQRVLGTARQWLDKSRDAKWAKLAPRSVAAAEQQLQQADQWLGRNRYDLTEPTRLAAQAVYEAQHAQYLYNLIATARDGDANQISESQWLALEQALKPLLAELSVEAKFDQGYAELLNTARDAVIRQQQELITARQDVTDLKDQLKETQITLKQLEAKLGGESEERQALQKKLITQERLRDNINKVESLFTAQEAQVYRRGGELVLSLSGINFRPGKSTIEPESFPLLTKLGESIRLFPSAAISVEGHTDNQGSESANLLLSQDRADAVRQYLVSNLKVDAEKVSSIGYGKARPVASNDTDTGRARNRRIDVILQIDGL